MSGATLKPRALKSASKGKAPADAAAPAPQAVESTTDTPPYLAPPVQRKCSACGVGASRPEDEDRPVQRDAGGNGGSTGSATGGASATGVQQAASASLAQASSPLPHAERIQAAFGRHDVSDVRTQIGGPAERASRRMGARAYAQGRRIGFRAEPDVRLAAHEAAHVVQQRRGVHLEGGVGREGDEYERQADAVAERVAAHQSAEDLLDANPQGTERAAVQAKCACGGTCPKCSGQAAHDEEEEEGSSSAVQMDLEANAVRLFEPMVADSEDMGDASASSAGGEAAGSREDGGETAASEDTDATAEDPADAAPEEPGSASGGESGTGDAGGDSGGGTAAGSCTPACYGAPSEQPAEEPEETPPNPEPTRTEEQTSAGDEEEAPEPDDCPVETPGGAAGAPVSGAAGDGAGRAAADSSVAAGPDSATTAGAGPAGETPASDAGAAGGGNVARESGNESAAHSAGGDAVAAMSIGSPMDGVVAAAEGQRWGAVARYQASSVALGLAAAGNGALRAGAQFAERPGESPDVAALRQTAVGRTSRFFGGVADRLDSLIGLASATLPRQLGNAAASAKAGIAASVEAQKGAISARIAQARRQARRDAATARAAVMGQEAAFVVEANSQAAAAIGALIAAHGETLGQVNELETTTLDQVNEVYAAGRTDLEGIGTMLGGECLAKGQEFAATYRSFSHCTENGFWDGNLSQRRAAAQADAATSVADGFNERMIEGARTRAREVTRNGRKADRCAVIASATQARGTLDTQLGALNGAVGTTLAGAIAQAGSTRQRLLDSIDTSLRATLRQLDQQEHDQRQAANDTGYMQQMLQEQIAHASAASIQEAVAGAAGSAQAALVQAQAMCAANEPPDPDQLEQALAQIEQNVSAALGSLHDGAVGGALAAEAEMAGAAGQGLGALAALAQANDEQTGALSGGLAASMSRIAGTDNFAGQRAGFTAQMVTSSVAGCAALAQVAEGMRQGGEAILEAARESLSTAHADLEANLRQGREPLECQMTRKADEAASHEAPAWKRLVAVLLVILVVVIVVAVTVLTAGMGLGVLATIAVGMAVGAAVGAVTSALLSVASDLWSNREVSVDRALDAAIEGAITGAIGGGLGAAAGLAAKGLSVAWQLGGQLVVASAVNVGTQLYHSGGSFENLSFMQLGFTLLVTVLTFKLAHHVASARAAATARGPMPEGPTPAAPAAETPVAPSAPESAPTGPPRLRVIQGGKSGSPEPVASPSAAPEGAPAPSALPDNVVPLRPAASGGGSRAGGGSGGRDFVFQGGEAVDMRPTFQPRPAGTVATAPEPVVMRSLPMPEPLPMPAPVESPPAPVPTPVEPTPAPTPRPAPSPAVPPGPVAPVPVIPPHTRPAPSPVPPPVAGPVPRPGPGPAPAPRPRPRPRPRPGPDEPQPADACAVRFGLIPGINARWHEQRSPIRGEITVSEAAFRLDAGIAPPRGQPTDAGSRDWARRVGRKKDDAGHVIARRFGGTRIFNDPEEGNIFPQNRRLNRGAMRSFDDVAAERHRSGCDVCVHLHLNYDSATALRPSSVTYTYLYRSPGNRGFNPIISAYLGNP